MHVSRFFYIRPIILSPELQSIIKQSSITLSSSRLLYLSEVKFLLGQLSLCFGRGELSGWSFVLKQLVNLLIASTLSDVSETTAWYEGGD